MPRAGEVPNGRHPSGAAICQDCGSAAALIADLGPDWLRRRVTSRLVCQNCATTEALVAERFRLTLVLTALSGA